MEVGFVKCGKAQANALSMIKQIESHALSHWTVERRCEKHFQNIKQYGNRVCIHNP